MFQNNIFLSLLRFLVFYSISAHAADDPLRGNCEPRRCRNGPNITYPFILRNVQPESCGSPGFELSCGNIGFPVLQLPQNEYIIKSISYASETVHVYDASILALNKSTICTPDMRNSTLPTNEFSFFNTTRLHLFPNCSKTSAENLWMYRIICYRAEGYDLNWDLAMSDGDADLGTAVEKCKRHIVAPVAFGADNIYTMLIRGFQLKWSTQECSTCKKSGGSCVQENNRFDHCLCSNKAYAKRCGSRELNMTAFTPADAPTLVNLDEPKAFTPADAPKRASLDEPKAFTPADAPKLANLDEPKGTSRKEKISRKVVEKVAVAGAAVIFIIVVILLRKKLLKLVGLVKAKPKKQVDIEFFLKYHGDLAPKRYKYSQLKGITNSFSENLGRGGYGSVYKGKLPDGRLVAVKILSGSKGNGEEFINEVSSISRTSHVNIVALFGFCFEGSRRALIYEFMTNGSLERFIPDATSSESGGSLGWEKLFEIAVGIARGIQYLHQGCSTRILHFDIKPHNILLDKDMKPKISDFGLAKLCPNRSSKVSMLGARGTAGYIAPEVFCRNFGVVSHKSDVYSYGMMVLELAVGRKDCATEGHRSSEMNFSDWVYKNLEQNSADKGVDCNPFVEEGECNFIKQKLIIVGLWCIQTEPKNRPSISRVIEMLEGNLESLKDPPQPHLSMHPNSSPYGSA